MISTMKNSIILLVLNLLCLLCYSQVQKGRVYDQTTGKGIAGATITSKSTQKKIKTGSGGEFEARNITSPDSLYFHFIGYKDRTIFVDGSDSRLSVGLDAISIVIEEVQVQTGYQTLRADQLSGSAQVLSESQLNQNVGSNILDRLNHVANAVFFDNQLQASDNQKLNFSIRGLSTIDGVRDPLIVLDGFIYEGTIQNIDPNNIESITILKDAAASAIWGARAGNGVLVIKSKSAKATDGLINVTFSKSIQFAQKPDLYDVYQMPAGDFIEIEKMLFDKGYYDRNIKRTPYNALTPVVSLLQQHKTGKIDSELLDQRLTVLKNIDSRSDYMKYFMEHPLLDQYALSLANGTEKNKFHLAVGYTYDKNQYGAKNSKVNIDFNDRMMLLPKLHLDIGFKYTNVNNHAGKPAFEGLRYRNVRTPYMDLVDENGNGLPIETTYDKIYTDNYLPGKLLSWNYIPYEDYKYIENRTSLNEYIGHAQLSYKVLPFLDLVMSYQIQNQATSGNIRNGIGSYYTRSLINSYANYDETTDRMNYPIPMGDILLKNVAKIRSYNWRGQINVNKVWEKVELSGIVGAEVRENKTDGESSTLYGYSSDPLKTEAIDFVSDFPIGINYSTSIIPGKPELLGTVNRFVSVYSNWNVEYNKRVGATASIRRDAANVFGVAANDKWSPFWSMGTYVYLPHQWNKLVGADRLKLRVSYGSSGNVDLRKTALPVASSMQFNYSPYSGLIISQLNDPYLRWEKIKTFNVGLDLSFFNDRIRGSIDHYRKHGTDLYGMTGYDYTTWGYLSFITKNVASMAGQGTDLIIETDNIRGKFSWSTTYNAAWNKSKTREYYPANEMSVSSFLDVGTSITPVPDYPLYGIAGFRSAGLNAEGHTQGYLNGTPSTDYTAIRNQPIDLGENGNIVFKGSSKPQVFGSIINKFSFKNWMLAVNASFYGDYYFMKNTTSYTQLFSSGKAYADFERRWRQPGDELNTTVPVLQYPADQLEENFYQLSENNILRADHIRLEYVRLSYRNSIRKIKLECFSNVSNLGLLWASNKEKIDPLYQDKVKPPVTFTFGASVKF